LHGHAHKPAFGSVAGPGGPTPVLGAPSASSTLGEHEPAYWHAIEIDAGADGPMLKVIVRGYDPQTGAVAEVGRYRLPPVSADIAA